MKLIPERHLVHRHPIVASKITTQTSWKQVAEKTSHVDRKRLSSSRLDFIEYQTSPVQRNTDLSTTYTNDHLKKTLPPISADTSSSVAEDYSSMFYRTKYPTFLPADFTVNESEGVTLQSTGHLNPDLLQHVKTIAKKINANQSNLFALLGEDETKLIRYVTAHDLR